MRKYIIPLFLLICPTVAWGIITDEDTGAIKSCSQYSTLQDCRIQGCEWYIPLNGGTSSETSRCKACDTHYYNDTSHCSSLNLDPCTCKPCPTPDDINLSYEWVASDTTIGLTEKSQCAFTVNCDAGQQLAMTADWKYTCVTCSDNYYQPAPTTITATYDNATDSYGYAIPECKKCGDFATHNDDHTNCDCNYGYRIKKDINNTENVGSENCYLIEFDVQYSDGSNTLDNEKVPSQYQKIHLTPKYPLTLPKIDCNQPSINGIPQSLCMTKTGYNFTNFWTADKKLNVCNPGTCLGELEAGSEIAVNATATLTADDMDDVIFTAVWKAKEFTVIYYNDDKQYDKPQECTYDTTCSAYIAPTPTDPTKYFAGWKCTSGCGEVEPKPVYQPGNNISNVSDGNNMELTAQWETCPAGHYCINNTVNPCPAGSTSDGGKTQITDCYINDKTQFCDINGGSCFTIPDLGIIYHK
ncbi:MAG: hypothetical protein IKL37_05010 [Alphaproteobacteria bacterium]|nr:hypothetical protein [Alphaproteobacteria bacterium]